MCTYNFSIRTIYFLWHKIPKSVFSNVENLLRYRIFDATFPTRKIFLWHQIFDIIFPTMKIFSDTKFLYFSKLENFVQHPIIDAIFRTLKIMSGIRFLILFFQWGKLPPTPDFWYYFSKLEDLLWYTLQVF